MNLVGIFRKVGWILFLLMWVPFVCIFAGMAQEFGEPGQQFARFVDGFFPGLLTARGSDMSLLTSVSMTIMFGMLFGAMALLFGAPLLGALENRKILHTGRAGTARIVSVNDTGTTVNNRPLVHITMEVQREDGSPFQAETEKILGYSQLGQFQPGATVNVRYDPDTLEAAISE